MSVRAVCTWPVCHPPSHRDYTFPHNVLFESHQLLVLATQKSMHSYWLLVFINLIQTQTYLRKENASCGQICRVSFLLDLLITFYIFKFSYTIFWLCFPSLNSFPDLHHSVLLSISNNNKKHYKNESKTNKKTVRQNMPKCKNKKQNKIKKTMEFALCWPTILDTGLPLEYS